MLNYFKKMKLNDTSISTRSTSATPHRYFTIYMFIRFFKVFFRVFRVDSGFFLGSFRAYVKCTKKCCKPGMPESRFPAEDHLIWRPGFANPGTSNYNISTWWQATKYCNDRQKIWGSRQSSRESLGHSTSAGRISTGNGSKKTFETDDRNITIYYTYCIHCDSAGGCPKKLHIPCAKGASGASLPKESWGPFVLFWDSKRKKGEKGLWIQQIEVNHFWSKHLAP